MSRSSDNIRMLNIIIGLCYDEPNMPNDLFKLGYEPTGLLIEQTINLGARSKVVPDLMMCSAQLASAVCWESKSGQNVEAKQAHSYSQVTPSNVNAMHNIREFVCDIVDVCYLCFIHNAQGLEVDLKRMGLPFSLISVYPTGIITTMNNVQQKALHDTLSSSLEIDLRKVPLRYRFDVDSSFFEVLPYVFQALVAYAIRQDVQPTTEEIAKDAYGEFWEVTGPDKRRRIVEIVRLVLEESMNRGLIRYLSKQAPNSRSIRSNATTKWVVRRTVTHKSVDSMQTAYDKLVMKMTVEPEFPELAKLY